GARQGHLAAARHSPANRPRAARNSQRAQEPRLQDRSCGSGSRGPAENRDFRAAMGCPPHARAAYESVARAGARAEMSFLSSERCAAVARDRARPGAVLWVITTDAVEATRSGCPLCPRKRTK